MERISFAQPPERVIVQSSKLWYAIVWCGFLLCYHLLLTVRANFREKISIEISSWNERTHHNHPRANRRYPSHHRLSTEDACGRIDRHPLPDQWPLDGLESGADVGRLVNLHYLRRRPSALSR